MTSHLTLSIAYWLSRLWPQIPDVNDTTDCYFFGSERAKRASTQQLREWQVSSAGWRYNYEISYRTLDYTFGASVEQYLRNKVVLDFGCGMGGAAAAWAELYRLRHIHGFEAEHALAHGARLFAGSKSVRAHFTAASGEDLPYRDNSFDAVISLDVFEHVRSIDRCLSECRRVLRSGGVLLAIFPPYFNPLGHHLKTTRTPALHWLFSGETLRKLQNRRLSELGPDFAYLSVPSIDACHAPYLNGITVRRWKRLIEAEGWRIIVDRRRGLPSFGRVARHPVFRMISAFTTPLSRMRWFEEIALDHVAMIIQKAER